MVEEEVNHDQPPLHSTPRRTLPAGFLVLGRICLLVYWLQANTASIPNYHWLIVLLLGEGECHTQWESHDQSATISRR